MRFVYAFRSYGHLAAELDPLSIQKKRNVPELDPQRYGIANKGKSYDLTGTPKPPSHAFPRYR